MNGTRITSPSAIYTAAVCCPFFLQVLLAQLFFRPDPLFINHFFPQIFSRPDIYADYHFYAAMAAGHFSGVTEPFAGRVLGPALASALAHLTGLPAERTLMFVCGLSWALVGIPAAFLFHRNRVPLNWALAISCVPFPLVGAGYFMVPDGLAVLLTLAFLAFWDARQNGAAAVTSGFSFLARSTTVVAGLLWALSSRRYRDCLILLIGLIAGVVVKSVLFGHGAGNVHALNPAVYYVAKVPVNLLGNIFGFHPYADTVRWCSKPIFVMALPTWTLLGHVREIGLCAFDFHPLLSTLLCYLFIFGLFPAFILRLWLMAGAGELGWKCALFLLLFLLAPGFGNTISRLFVEAFPFFLALAGPAIIALGLADSKTWLKCAWLYNAVSYLVIVIIVFLFPPAGIS